MEHEVSDDRRCLHCDETKASIKSQGIVLCGIVKGYYEPELSDEWPNHRWRDWTDRDLDQWGILPEAYEKHRRTLVRHLEWVGCEDTKRGHMLATEADYEFGLRVGQCHACGKMPHPTEPPSRDEV